NMRNMLSDYNAIGEEFWNRFNAPKHLQAWYYSNLCDGLEELQDYENTKAVYWEMMQLYKDLFVQFFVDDSKVLLYQISDSNEGYVLKKGKPQWNELSGSPSKKARLISRKEAERIEDNWAEPFWDVHALDLSDASYELYNESDGYIFIEIKDGVLSFNDEFLNPPDPSTGFHSDIYYTLNTDDTHRFLVQLRLKHGIRNKLSTILKKEFGYSDGPQKFNAFCNEIGVQVQVIRF
ncbi:MAG: hypothetical protein IIV14_04040, partial [Bacteroidaceae bacterium]|nr:hypothetical protein [Bacteroidaceae bacterium]